MGGRVTKSVTIATAKGGRQRTSTDGLSQATHAAALVARAASWLRDEEAEFTSTEVVYGLTGTEVTELPEYGVSP